MKKIWLIFWAVLLIGNIFAEEPIYHGTVHVNASRSDSSLKDLPVNVTVITGDDIEKTQAVTLRDVLRVYGGFMSISYTGSIGAESTARVRGGGSNSSQHTLVLIDGQVVNDQGRGDADIGQIYTENIERIEIIRGGSSSLWGSNAIGAVINIITKKGQGKLNSKFKVMAGSFGRRIYSVNSGYSSAESRVKDLYISVAGDNCDGWRDNSDYEGIDGLMNIGFKISGNSELDLRTLFHKSRYGLPGTGGLLVKDYDGKIEKIADTPNARMDYTRNDLQLKYSLYIGDETKISLRPYYTENDKIASDVTYNNPIDVTTCGAELEVNTVYDIVAGYDLKRDGFIRKDEMVIPSNTIVDKETMINAAFLQKTINFKKLKTILSARYDEHSVFGSEISPKASLVLTPNERVKFSASSGKSFRAPTFEDLYYPEDTYLKGNEGLSPETAWVYDLGVEYKYNDALVTSFTLYRSDIKDMIEWAPIDPSDLMSKWTPTNIEEAYNQGVEVEVINKITTGLKQKFNYTYLESESKIPGRTSYSRLQYTPNNKISYVIDYSCSCGFDFMFHLTFVDDQKWGEMDFQKIPAYVVADLALKKNINSVSFYAKINNIFDKMYQTRIGYPIPGRTIYGGVQIKI
ncbi:MAG: TonB-dependent receptor [Elusimicrobiota bacterium]